MPSTEPISSQGIEHGKRIATPAMPRNGARGGSKNPLLTEKGRRKVSSRNSDPKPIRAATVAVADYDTRVGEALSAIDRKRLHPMLGKVFAAVRYLRDRENEAERFYHRRRIEKSPSSIGCFRIVKWFFEQTRDTVKSRTTKIASAIQYGIEQGDTGAAQFESRLRDEGGIEGLYGLYVKKHRDETPPSQRWLEQQAVIEELLDGRGDDLPINIGDKAPRKDGNYLAVISVRDQVAHFRIFLWEDDEKKTARLLAREGRLCL